MKDNMFLKAKAFLRCPKCLAQLEPNSVADCLICQGKASHRFPIVNGIPSFVRREEISTKDAKWVFEYDEEAEEYDRHVEEYNEWLGIDLKKERIEVLERVPIKPSHRILDVSTGTGAVIIELRQIHQDIACDFVGTDLSMGMLRVAQRKLTGANMKVPLLHSQVKEFPFEDESFDIITHIGGINTFQDIPATLDEWVRVLKPDGLLLVSDEGLSPTARKTQRGVKIVKDNRLFGLQPPLEDLPPTLKNIELRWVAKDTFYTMTCQKFSKKELRQLRTDGTEHARIRRMVETFLKGH